MYCSGHTNLWKVLPVRPSVHIQDLNHWNVCFSVLFEIFAPKFFWLLRFSAVLPIMMSTFFNVIDRLFHTCYVFVCLLLLYLIVLHKWTASKFNPLTPKDLYISRTPPLTSKRCILYIYSTNVGTEYFKHALYSPFFFSSKCSLFHNANFFGSCIIHILYTECAEIKKK